jgi:hypothetical protein
MPLTWELITKFLTEGVLRAQVARMVGTPTHELPQRDPRLVSSSRLMSI